MTRATERTAVHPRTEAVAILVAVAHERLAADFATGTPGFDFDDACWDIRALKDRSTNRATPRLYFTRYGTTDEPLPPQYAMVVKSWPFWSGDRARPWGQDWILCACCGKQS
jgi:hypothetical protein